MYQNAKNTKQKWVVQKKRVGGGNRQGIVTYGPS